MKPLPIIAIAGGDPAGVGPQVALEAALASLRGRRCIPVIFTSARCAAATRAWREAGRLAEVVGKFGEAVRGSRDRRRLWIVEVETPGAEAILRGRPSEEAAEAALRSLRKATEAVMAGGAAALVTAPVSKEWMSRIEPFPGHTEWLASAAGLPPDDVVMAFIGRKMAVATVTRHLPLGAVPEALRIDAIVKAVVLLCASLVLDFRRRRTRMGVCSLNPHASDGGLLGDEEEKIVTPAVRLCRETLARAGWERRISLGGPAGADGIMGQMSLGLLDAAVAMYHDQAMIAAKIMEPLSCAGITLGLPFIRTTPMHGTAFDIAGKGRPSASSTLAAVALAAGIARQGSALLRELDRVRGLIAGVTQRGPLGMGGRG
jgi:4-hydroxythreonine-4-phosphate dehydrogenase